MSIRDSLVYDAKQLANETITNFAFYLGLNMAGIPRMIFTPEDGLVIGSIKSAIISSGANIAGAAARGMWPQLAFFN